MLQPRPGHALFKDQLHCPAPPSRWPRLRPALGPADHLRGAPQDAARPRGRPPRMSASVQGAASSASWLRGRSVTNSWKIRAPYTEATPRAGAQVRSPDNGPWPWHCRAASRHARRDPWRPCTAPAVRAHRAWLEQMLLLAFSRRMCCSRACRVRTKARSPSIVRGLAHDAAGQLAHELLGGGHEAQVRPAEGEGHAQGLALAHGHVRAAARRGSSATAQAMGLHAHDILGPGLRGRSRRGPRRPRCRPK